MITRKIRKNGSIYFGNRIYKNQELKLLSGLEVGVDKINDSTIEVYNVFNGVVTDTKICTAYSNIVEGEKEMLFKSKKLKDYRTKDLVKELISRKGISHIKTHGHQYQVKTKQHRIKESEDAVILVIRESVN